MLLPAGLKSWTQHFSSFEIWASLRRSNRGKRATLGRPLDIGCPSPAVPLQIDPLSLLPLPTPFVTVGGGPHCIRTEFSLERFIYKSVHPNITGAPRSRGIATTITSGLFCLNFRSPPKPTIFAPLLHGSSSLSPTLIIKMPPFLVTYPWFNQFSRKMYIMAPACNQGSSSATRYRETGDGYEILGHH